MNHPWEVVVNAMERLRMIWGQVVVERVTALKIGERKAIGAQTKATIRRGRSVSRPVKPTHGWMRPNTPMTKRPDQENHRPRNRLHLWIHAGLTCLRQKSLTLVRYPTGPDPITETPGPDSVPILITCLIFVVPHLP